MLVLGRAFKTLGGLVGMLTVYLAMPAGFVIFGGNPIAAFKAVAATPLMRDDGTLFLAGVTVFGWIAWAYFAIGFLLAVLGKLSGRNLRLPGFGPAQALAALMLATITTTAAAPALSSARAVTTVSYSQARPAIVISTPEHADVEHAADADSHLQVADNAVTHVVQNRETLLDLAERYYNDSDAISLIIDANLGVIQPDGRSLQQGTTRVHAGWKLTIPAPTVSQATPASKPMAAPANRATAPIYQTQRGDYLWHIADRYLGDPERYTEIAACNPDLINDPDEIQPGWHLTLPDDATDRGERTHATGSLLKPQSTTDAPVEVPEAQPDDGPDVVMPQPAHTQVPQQTQSPTPPTTTERPTTTTATPAAEHQAAEQDRNRSAVHLSLASGGWITGGLMVALATAWFLVRRQRARFRRPEFPITITHSSGDTEQSATVRGIAEAGLADRYQHQLTADDNTWRPNVVSSVGIDSSGAEISLHHHLGGATALTGPANADAARAIIAATLASSIRRHGPERADLTTDALTLTQLLHGQHAPQLARLIVTDSAERTAAALEREVLHRSRMLASNEAESIDAINADPDLDPIDGFVAVVPADERLDARVLAAAEQGRHLGVTVVILGATAEVPSAHIETGGTVASESGHSEHPTLHGGRIANLTADDLAAVLCMLGEAEDNPQPEDAGKPDSADVETSGTPLTSEDRHEHFTEPEPAADPLALAPVRVTEMPVTLALLGTPSLHTARGGEIVNGTRGRTFPLLAFLASHPHQDHSLEEIAFQLEPDADLNSTKDILRVTISVFRKALRTATESDDKYLIQERYRYRINPELVEVDLWRMHAYLAEANRAEDDDTALAALSAAVACYRGDFATGFHHLWITDKRTTYRNQVTDALSRIAAIHETDQPDAALAALERAYGIEEPHGINEPMIQTIMRIQGRIGRYDSVRRTMQLLRDRLWADAQRTPDPATERVYARMVNAHSA